MEVLLPRMKYSYEIVGTHGGALLPEQNPSCVSALKSLLLSNDDGDVNDNGNKKVANI